MMKMVSLALIAAVTCSCATLNESMTLGVGMGSVAGGAATYVAQSTAPDKSASLGNIALGAGIGAAVGAITSYFTHKSVEGKRAACMADQTEMHFGDLPPSPFVFPKTLPKKGNR